MSLPPSLRALLGPIAQELDDPCVDELLISGVDRAFVVRDGLSSAVRVEISDARLRATADRILRFLSKGSAGALDATWEAQVVGGTRSDAPPIVRIVRRRHLTADLPRLVEVGAMSVDVASALENAAQSSLSLVVSGNRVSGKTALMASILRAWQSRKRIAVFEHRGGPFAEAGLGHVFLDPDNGIEDALLLGADVLIADAPKPSLWRYLLVGGRPFLASIEASDSHSAVTRIVARVLSADSAVSRAAAEALLESGIDLVVETSFEAEAGVRVRQVTEPCRERGTLVARAILSSHSPAAKEDASPERRTLGESPIPGAPASIPPRPLRGRRRAGDLSGSDREKPASFPPSDLGSPAAIRDAPVMIEVSSVHSFGGDISEIRAEQLVSKSFVMKLDEIEHPEPSIIPIDDPVPRVERREVVERTPTVITEAPTNTSLGPVFSTQLGTPSAQTLPMNGSNTTPKPHARAEDVAAKANDDDEDVASTLGGELDTGPNKLEMVLEGETKASTPSGVKKRASASRIDPNRAAVASGEEFEAILDSLREVTNDPGFTEERTENSEADAPPISDKARQEMENRRQQRRIR